MIFRAYLSHLNVSCFYCFKQVGHKIMHLYICICCDRFIFLVQTCGLTLAQSFLKLIDQELISYRY